MNGTTVFNRCFVTRVALVFAMSSWSALAVAEVTDKAANGFTSVNRITVKRAPDTVWQALINIGHWWSKDHTYSGDASNFYLEPRAGGCFCESLPSGGSVEHLHVVFVQRPKTLRMVGGLGPLQALGVTGSWTFDLVARPDGGTDITLTAVVGGYRKEGLDGFAAPVDGVLHEQLGRLAALVDKP